MFLFKPKHVTRARSTLIYIV